MDSTQPERSLPNPRSTIIKVIDSGEIVELSSKLNRKKLGGGVIDNPMMVTASRPQLMID